MLSQRTIVVLAASAVATLALADVSLTAVVETYEVQGSTFEEVLASLDRNAPLIARTGQRHYGVTRISFSQSATFQQALGECELLSNDIRLEIEMVLPEWPGAAKADPLVAARWTALSETIAAHEERHAEIAQDYLARMRAELDQPRTAEDCPTLKSEMNRRMDALVEEHRAAQEGFDEETRRGLAPRDMSAERTSPESKRLR